MRKDYEAKQQNRRKSNIVTPKAYEEQEKERYHAELKRLKEEH